MSMCGCQAIDCTCSARGLGDWAGAEDDDEVNYLVIEAMVEAHLDQGEEPVPIGVA